MRVNLSNVTEPVFIDSQEVCPGVFIGKCMVDSVWPVVRILNTTNEIKLIHNCVIKTEKLSNYHIYSIEKTTSTSDRVQTLQKTLKDKIQNYVRDDLMSLCTEYADIFTLENDKWRQIIFMNRDYDWRTMTLCMLRIIGYPTHRERK